MVRVIYKLVVSANWKPLFVEKHHHNITFMFIQCLSTITLYLVVVSQSSATSIYLLWGVWKYDNNCDSKCFLFENISK